MEDDVITLSYSDDDDCFVLEHIINLEPIVVDLTKESDHASQPTAPPSQRSSHRAPEEQKQYQQPHQQQPTVPSKEFNTKQFEQQTPSPKRQPNTHPYSKPQPDTHFHSRPNPYPHQNFFSHPYPQQNTFSRPHPFFAQYQQQQPRPYAHPTAQPQSPPHQPQSPPQQPTVPPQQPNIPPQQANHEPPEQPKQYSQPSQQYPNVPSQRPNNQQSEQQEQYQPQTQQSQAQQQQPLQQQPTVPLQQTNNKQQPEEQKQPQQQQQQQEVPQKTLSDHELLIAKKNLGNENYKNNLLNEAVRTYREASELAKKLGDKEMAATIHFNLAMTYDRLGSCNQAADECALAVKLKDNYMKPHLKRAEIYERLHKFEEAVICWEHICELDQSNRDYAIRLARVREAAKRLRKKEPHELLGLHPINFSREDLKRAYKKKALSHHPDRHPDADIVTRRIHEKLFKDASKAHSHIQVRFGYSR